MSWGEWMVVDLTYEEELRIEQQARSIIGASDDAQVRDLCASFAKQNAYQQKRISQAGKRISALEVRIALDAAEALEPGACAERRSRYGLDSSGHECPDRSRLSGIQDRSLFSSVLLTALAPLLWLLGYFLGLLVLAKRTMNRAIRGLAS